MGVVVVVGRKVGRVGGMGADETGATETGGAADAGGGAAETAGGDGR